MFDDSISVTAQLFQAEVHPKVADARVTVVGDHVFAQAITTTDGALDWRSGDWDELIYTTITVPPAIRDMLNRYLRAFGLLFGCFDFALTGDACDPAYWTFIECNPNGQWGWLPDAPTIAEAFADLLNARADGRL